MKLDFATAWEAISDEIPDSDALIQGDLIRSWREYEDRAARLASAIAEQRLDLKRVKVQALEAVAAREEAQQGVAGVRRPCQSFVDHDFTITKPEQIALIPPVSGG